jgi:hypothetical protein
MGWGKGKETGGKDKERKKVSGRDLAEGLEQGDLTTVGKRSHGP